MAVAAFKSSSKRASSSSSLKETKDHPISPRKKPNSPNKPRRSRSVSAVSRPHLENSSSDFLIKRDNPLYWSNVSPPDQETHHSLPKNINKSLDADNNTRGRSVSRNANVPKTDIRSSLSRVDTGRSRSLSRRPTPRTHFLNSESDVEQRGTSLSKYTDKNDLGRASNVRRINNSVRTNSFDTIEGAQSFPRPTPTHGSSINLPSRNLSWEDGVISSFLSEPEEKICGLVCDQMKSFQESDFGGDASSRIFETVRSEVRRAIADIQNDLEYAIRRSDGTAVATTNITDIPPDLVNPSAVELVLDIRREYARKLEQSQERARKLRADLAIEEHRGLELSRILKEVLPDPKMSNVQKPRPGKKSSIERRKMSKRLTEEAMAYFDECVSLSTFDSSDFSSPEDPPINLVGTGALVGDHGALVGDHDSLSQAQGSTRGQGTPGKLTTSSSKMPLPDEISLNSSETQWDGRMRFSFSDDQNDTFEFQHGVRNYIKNLGPDMEKVNVGSHVLRSNCIDLDEYNLQAASAQSFLFDRVFCKNKIESGSMLLCGGGISVMLSPFASVV